MRVSASSSMWKSTAFGPIRCGQYAHTDTLQSQWQSGLALPEPGCLASHSIFQEVHGATERDQILYCLPVGQRRKAVARWQTSPETVRVFHTHPLPLSRNRPCNARILPVTASVIPPSSSSPGERVLTLAEAIRSTVVDSLRAFNL